MAQTEKIDSKVDGKAVLCKIGGFYFHMSTHHVESFQQRFSYGYTAHQRVGRHPVRHAHGKHDETLEFSGTLYLEKQSSLDAFAAMAAEKKPVAVIMGYAGGTHLGEFVIRELSLTRKDLTPVGAALTQAFSVKLERVFEEEAWVGA